MAAFVRHEEGVLDGQAGTVERGEDADDPAVELLPTGSGEVREPCEVLAHLADVRLVLLTSSSASVSTQL
ncbi:hypothetical protein ACWGF3_17740 [Streptomyces xanthophaeus]